MKKPQKPMSSEPKPTAPLLALLIVTVCAVIQAAAVALLYLPHHFPSGGITGISVIINTFTGWPIWLIILVLDIPGFVIAFRMLDMRFMWLSLAGTLAFSAAFALVGSLSLPVADPFLAAVFGGVIVGATGAVAVQVGGSMGGLDIITLLLNRVYGIQITTFAMLLNAIVLVAMVFFAGLEPAMLTMVGIYASSLGFNVIMDGFNRTKTVLIISEESAVIAPAIMEKVGRGVTYLNAEGAFTGSIRKVIYCILRTTELVQVKAIVKSIDPHAMFSVIDTREVTGRGFSAL